MNKELIRNFSCLIMFDPEYFRKHGEHFVGSIIMKLGKLPETIIIFGIGLRIILTFIFMGTFYRFCVNTSTKVTQK